MPTRGHGLRSAYITSEDDPLKLRPGDLKGSGDFRTVLVDSMEVPNSELDRVLARNGPALGGVGGDRDDGGFATGLGSPYPPCPTASAALRGSVLGGSDGYDPCPTWQEQAAGGARAGVLYDSYDGGNEYEPAPLAAPSPYAPGYRGAPSGDVSLRGGFGAPTFVGPAPKPPFRPSSKTPTGDQMLTDHWGNSERAEMPPLGQVFSANQPMPKPKKPASAPEMLLEG